jgi:MFS family permease
LLTAANTTIQLTTEPAIRGRVLALYMMVLLGATPIGSPFVGWVGEQFGPRWALGVGSLTALLIAGLATLWAVRNWDLQIQYRFREHPRLQILNPRDLVDEQTAKLKATAAGHRTTQA